LFKTRSQAGDACSKGKVKCNGDNVKAAKVVNLGDVYDVKTEARRWVVKVTGLLEKRVQYSEAILHYEDQTPPEELDRVSYEAATYQTGKRLSKIGRPTKKQRRDIEGFME
jgi:ribosome-associated heat shock protein Hsp15